MRVQVPGPSEFIATFLADRLDRRLTRLNAEAVLRYWPDPARPPLAGPTGEKPIVRRQHCALLTGTPDDAVRAMDAMDYDAYLYTDAETGEDAIVYWAGAGRAGLVEKVGDRWAVEERGEHGELGEMWGRKSAQTFHRALGRHAQCV
ncbi:sigma 54 modulation/S30EA ribosomal C-terminal domain-containing protein [Nocardia sp. NPDC052278]|uniref:sigma 54 modulation/S30EA ribosomal C-terminal domain-containing protein n=1 Tax=unclassified Nocardia TaxID=2637762 RepID=UPI0036987E39